MGKSFRSPFSIHAKVRNGKIIYPQFMEDKYASASSFRQSDSWTVKTDPAAPGYEVGENNICNSGAAAIATAVAAFRRFYLFEDGVTNVRRKLHDELSPTCA